MAATMPDAANMEMYPMRKMNADGQNWLPLRAKLLWAAPAFGWYGLKYHKGAYMKKFFIDDYPTASLGILAMSSALSVIVDAFTDPKMANVTDNFKSKYGRRRPFVVVSAFLVPAAFILHWVPVVPSGTAASVWFAVFHICFKLVDTFFLIPFDAWGAGLSPVDKEQTSIFMWREIFATFGIFFGMAILPLAFDNSGECSSTPATGCVPAPMIATALSVVFMMSCFTLAYFGKEPSANAMQQRMMTPSSPSPAAKTLAYSETDTIPGLMATFLNTPFRSLLIAIMTQSIARDIPFAILPFVAEWIIGQKYMESGLLFGIMALINIFGNLLALPCWNLLARYVGKFRAYVTYNISISIMFASLIGLGRDSGDGVTTMIACPLFFLLGVCTGGSFLLQSILADVIDYDDYLSGGIRREAMYMMAIEFMPKFMNIPGEVLPMWFLARYNYARPPLDKVACIASNYTNTSAYTGLSLDDMCSAYYRAESAGQALCSSSKRCSDLVLDGVGFVCNTAVNDGTCSVVQNSEVFWILRLFFSLVPALFVVVGVVPLWWYPNDEISSMRSKGPRAPTTEVSEAGPNSGILAYFWPSELHATIASLPAQAAPETTCKLTSNFINMLLLKVVVCLLLLGAGIAVVILGFNDLGNDLGDSVSPLGLIFAGFGLVGLWWSSSRMRAALHWQRCGIPCKEVANKYNRLCPFIAAPPINRWASTSLELHRL